jgi:hypothetical protein
MVNTGWYIKLLYLILLGMKGYKCPCGIIIFRVPEAAP